MLAASRSFYFETFEIFGLNFEFKDIAHKTGTLIPRVPVTSNLFGIFFRQNRIKDRLLGKGEGEMI